jgi:pectin methylesterase-like acyl-CoA thioesterase/pectate lyase
MLTLMLFFYSLLPAFPGAEGAGMYTTGGRGTINQPTTVMEVTRLQDDDQPGSLRYALTSTAAYRTVIFRVSGTIHLLSPLGIKSNTTIAGQTAPGGGICVADYPVSIAGDNVIVRYMRFRLGDKNQQQTNGNDDAFGGLGHSDIIIDHVSASWSNDEVLSIYRGDYLTIQWCLISEPLNYSYHFETGDKDYENHGYGGIWGAKHGTMHHNLFAHCRNRNPRFAGVSTYTPNTPGTENVDFRNNVIYDWGINTVYGGERGNYNVVNNYYRSGPSTSKAVRYRICNPSPDGKWFVEGNYVDGSPANTANNWLGVTISDTELVKMGVPHNIGVSLPAETATDAFERVLNNVGCSFSRDTLDQRVISDVQNRTGRIIDVQGGYAHGTSYNLTTNAWPALVKLPAPKDSDHDGMPDAYEKAHGLNPSNAADRNGYAPNGYTNLENYLNSLVLKKITVAKDGSGDYNTVQEAINASDNGTIVYIKNGVYKEKLVLPESRINVHFIGESADKTVLTFDDYASRNNMGTSGSASFCIYGAGFTAENITFENSAGPVGQAVAVRVTGDKATFINCRFLGFQDTLYTHGADSRQYYRHCYIEGTVDFIFGASTALFDSCTIYGKRGGYYTAASTPEGKDFGYVFLNCNIEGDAPASSYYLGRPWRPWAKTVFIGCLIARTVTPQGWHNWGKAEDNVFYAEYNNRGEGALTSGRVGWSHQLTEEEAQKYTIKNVLSGWLP